MLVIVSIVLTDVKRNRMLGIGAPQIAAPSNQPEAWGINV
jgi:hypothetical protein